MAQINLLKQSSGARNHWYFAYQLWVRVLFAVLLVILAYYGWLFFTLKSADSVIVSTREKINNDQQAALNSQDRNELLTRQLQLRTLGDVQGQHFYWSQLLPALAQTTLKTASYSNFTAGSDGEIILTATVPTLTDLDEYLQVFNLPQFYKNFSEVNISGYHQVQGQNVAGNAITFEVKMHYNPSLIQYQSQSPAHN